VTWTTALAISFVALAAVLGAPGLPRVRRALADPEADRAPEVLLSGLRRLIVAAALLTVSAGTLSGQTWLLLFGLVFLAEEAVECTVHLGIARHGRVRSAASRAGR
jgi:hypothetical protein